MFFPIKNVLFAVTEVSPIIIDEESGIVYSPGLKRSDYMAQRLKDMKEKRENLSPTGMCNMYILTNSKYTAFT